MLRVARELCSLAPSYPELFSEAAQSGLCDDERAATVLALQPALLQQATGERCAEAPAEVIAPFAPVEAGLTQGPATAWSMFDVEAEVGCEREAALGELGGFFVQDDELALGEHVAKRDA